MNVAVLLFENFETLDAFGPVEIFGRLTDLYSVRFYSIEGGLVHNHHGVIIQTEKLEHLDQAEIFLLPGGIGTRKLVEDQKIVDAIRDASNACVYVLTVCTGSALLAKTGLLDGRKATSNKRAFSWASSNGVKVHWDKTARWTVDGKFYTSSGVSAGMDMSLGFLSGRFGADFARNVAAEIEYRWNEYRNDDAFKAL